MTSCRVLVRGARLLCCLALALGAASCLPDRKSDEELAQALDAYAAAHPADVVAAQGCGNGKVEGQEQCDEVGANQCSGCEKCQRRRSLLISSAQDVATYGGKGISNLVEHAADGFSMEFWFSPDALPNTDSAHMMAALAGTALVGADNQPGFAVLLATDAVKSASYVTCAYWPHIKDTKVGLFLQGADAIKIKAWHHVRCAWSGKDLVMRMWLDGQAPTETAKVASKPAQLFDASSTFFVGALIDKAASGFSGRIDELRILVGAAAADSGVWRYRYVGNEVGTQLLLHMDEPDEATFLRDSSANALDPHQTSKPLLPKQPEKALHFAPEDCYGFSHAQATCKNAAPFCP